MTDETKARLSQMLHETDALTDTVMLWLASSDWTPVIVAVWTAAAFALGVWVGW